MPDGRMVSKSQKDSDTNRTNDALLIAHWRCLITQPDDGCPRAHRSRSDTLTRTYLRLT